MGQENSEAENKTKFNVEVESRTKRKAEHAEENKLTQSHAVLSFLSFFFLTLSLVFAFLFLFFSRQFQSFFVNVAESMSKGMTNLRVRKARSAADARAENVTIVFLAHMHSHPHLFFTHKFAGSPRIALASFASCFLSCEQIALRSGEHYHSGAQFEISAITASLG